MFALKVYEKEIQLLKQSESLHKNQEESKVLEVVNTIQAKLVQKNSKIECLKTKLNSAETNAGKLNKVGFYVTFLKIFVKFKNSQSV